MMTIDLHMHSTVSDGTDTPEELLGKVRASGLGVFSVTDHDAVKACALIRPLLGEGDPVLIDGVEFSCRDEEGKYHILGYGYEPGAEPIRTLTESGRRHRLNKARMRVDFLRAEFGFSFSDEELAWLFAQHNPGKPHIARLMVARGWAGSVSEAIEDYLDRLSCPTEYLRPEEAIARILESGGIPVLAHPVFGSGSQLIRGADMDRRVRRLTEYGLSGLEAYYSGFSDGMIAEMLSLAGRYDLCVTAGSDYHGANKPIRIGQTRLGASMPERLERFLAAVVRH